MPKSGRSNQAPVGEAVMTRHTAPSVATVAVARVVRATIAVKRVTSRVNAQSHAWAAAAAAAAHATLAVKKATRHATAQAEAGVVGDGKCTLMRDCCVRRALACVAGNRERKLRGRAVCTLASTEFSALAHTSDRETVPHVAVCLVAIGRQPKP